MLLRRGFVAALIVSGAVSLAHAVQPAAHAVVRLSDVRPDPPGTVHHIEDDEPIPPRNRPLSAAQRASAINEVRHVVALQTVHPQSIPPSVTGSFAALGDDGTFIPPDTQGAVSPNQLFVALNSQVSVQDRSGNRLTIGSHNNFWRSVTGGKGAFDPRLIYDSLSNRWLLAAAANGSTANSAVLLAVSRTADAAGSWDLYKFDGDANHKNWFDQPEIGVTPTSVIITGNMYSNSTGDYVSGELFLFDKASLYAGNASRNWIFPAIVDGDSLAPVTSFDPAATTNYIVQSWNGNSSNRGWLRVYSVNSSGLQPINFVSGTDTWDYQATDDNFAPQLGSSMKIYACDDRIKNAVYRNGSIWLAHTVFRPSGQVSRTGVQWWQIAVSPLAVVQRGIIEDPTNATWYAFPTIAVNRNNDVVIGGSQFGAGISASAFVAFRASADAPNTLSYSAVSKAGEAPYYKIDGTGKDQRNRWGDYSASVVDPANDVDFWTIQEYAAAPSLGVDRWGTWWTHLSPLNVPANALQMLSGRYAVTLAARDWRTGKTANGVPSQETDVFGYFSLPDLTGNATNPEVFVKVIGPVNGVPWIFYAGLTDVEYTVTVADLQTGEQRRYSVSKPDPSAGAKAYGNFDVGGATSSHCDNVIVTTTFGARTTCSQDGATLCLLHNRFKLTLSGRDQRSGKTANAVARPKNDLFGFFSLPGLTGDPNNIEAFVKMLDASSINSGFWAFLGGLTDFEYTLRITDTATGKMNTYLKPADSTCGWNHVPAF